MSDLRQAAQQALEALHNIEWHGSAGAWMLDDCKVENAIHALRAALAEPVPESKHANIAEWRADKQRKPLTDGEIHDCFQQKHKDKVTERRMITRAIEQAHGIKDA